MNALPARLGALVCALVCALALSAPAAFAAQPKVDLTGVWIGARSDPQSPYKDTRYPNPPPFTEAGKAQSKFWAEPANNLGARCLPGGGPAGSMGASTYFPIEIIQKPGHVTIIDENMGMIRRVYLDEKHPAPDDLERTWMGHSVGRWDGDVLTVDTIGVHHGSMNGSGATVNEQTVQVEPRMPYSETLHLTERIRLLDRGAYLEDELTIEDPTLYTQPIKVTHYWRKASELKMLEYVCTETLNGDASAASADKLK